MELDKFMGFVRLLKTDMYAVASSMINYVKIPPYGVNTFEMAKGLGASRNPNTINIDDWNPDAKRSNNKGKNTFLDNASKKNE
jgi:hypothetical protein